MAVIDRLDRFQRRHPHAGLPLAVVYKFFDDQGSYLAALITYYGFVSIVPLLLLATTILNFVLEGHPGLQQDLLNSAIGQFPIVGTQLSDHKGVTGSGVGLLIGVLGTIYGSLGVAQAVQNAMNTVWRVPRNSRPNPVTSRLRSLLLVGVVGLSVIGTTALQSLASIFDSIGTLSNALIALGTFAINATVFTAAFRLATARDISLRQTLPGAIVAAAVWQALQYVGTQYVQHIVAHASEVDSFFALVLGLVAWIYVEAFVVVMAVEYNTVRSFKLYPRALLTPFTDDVDLTKADRISYAQQAKAARFKGYETIDVRFEPRDED